MFVQGLSAVFYDATGRVVGTGTVRSMLYENVLPGEIVPFVIEFNSVDGLDGIVTYDFLLSCVVCGVTRFHTPTALSDYALNDPAKGFFIVATFRNDRAHPIKELRAVATLYDRQGDVLWVDTWDPPPLYEVRSGETSTYEIPTYIDFGNAVAGYRVMLRAVEQP